MIDKTQEIQRFLRKHFTPGTLEDHTFLKTNHGVLNLLFDVFPEDCIDTYELHEIMTSLYYVPVKKSTEKEKKPVSKTKTVGFSSKKENKPLTKITNVKFYWCLKSI